MKKQILTTFLCMSAIVLIAQPTITSGVNGGIGDEIKFEEHLNFIDSLKLRKDKLYFLVKKEDDFKNIFTQSTQARLIQMFALVTDKELKYGVKVDSNGEHARRVLGEPDLTYLFGSYFVENEKIQSSSLQQLDHCLQKLTADMGGVRLRKPAATEPDSYLRPGYLCSSVAEN